MAGLDTLVATCDTRGINPFAYLADVIPRVQDHPKRRLEKLLPGPWARAGASPTSLIVRLRNSSNSSRDGRSSRDVCSAGTFIALDVSYRLIEALRKVVPAIHRNDRDLADQIRRAATSVSLNLAEGQRSMKGNRQKHYAIAQGSANEVRAGLFVAIACGWVEQCDRAVAIL